MSSEPQLATSAESGGPRLVDAILADHVEHLLDYCNNLLGDPSAAAALTEAALVAAQTVLLDPDKLRAWLFAVARADAQNKGVMQPYAQSRKVSTWPIDDSNPPGGEDELVTQTFDAAEIETTGAFTSQLATNVADTLPESNREVLDLVYRHGIQPLDLTTILGLPPESVQALLQSAKEALAAGMEGRSGGLESPREEQSRDETDPDNVASATLASEEDTGLGALFWPDIGGDAVTDGDASVRAGWRYQVGEEQAHDETNPANVASATSSSEEDTGLEALFWADIGGDAATDADTSDRAGWRRRVSDPGLRGAHRRARLALMALLSTAAAIAGLVFLISPMLHHARETGLPNPATSRPASSSPTATPPGQTRAQHQRSRSTAPSFTSYAPYSSFPAASGAPTPSRSSSSPNPTPTISSHSSSPPPTSPPPTTPPPTTPPPSSPPPTSPATTPTP